MIKLILAMVVLSLSACGTQSKSAGDENPLAPAASPAASQPTTNGNSATSFSVTSASDQPICNSARTDNLVYIKAEATFEVCDGSNWSAINVKGEKGDTGAAGAAGTNTSTGIASIWRYSVDTLVTSIVEGNSYYAYVGTIQLVQFTNGSGYVTVSGAYLDTDSASNVIKSNFEYSFFEGSLTTEQTYMAKFSSYANSRIRIKVLGGATPTVKATVDTDGNWANNTDVPFILNQVQ